MLHLSSWMVTLPMMLIGMVGIILVMSFFMDREKYRDVEVTETVNWYAVAGVILGAVVANVVSWGIASINGMIVAAVCYLIGHARKNR